MLDLYWGWSIFSGVGKSGIKDLFRAGMKNLFGDEKPGKKNPFGG
jgi:hypothetical protein